ncbi:MAG: hypothetical protein QM758_02530 [Armatimonas sp.]
MKVKVNNPLEDIEFQGLEEDGDVVIIARANRSYPTGGDPTDYRERAVMLLQREDRNRFAAEGGLTFIERLKQTIPMVVDLSDDTNPPRILYVHM